MKKILGVVLAAFLLFGIFAFSIASAQEDSEDDAGNANAETTADDNAGDAAAETDTETEDEEDEEGEDEVAEEVDDETESETEIMDTSYGAKMRLLQLERAIKRRILWANAVINVLEEKGEDVSELQSIVAELELLVEELQSISTERANQEAVKEFVNIKLDAKDLIKEFRKKARALLSAEDKEVLREEFAEIDRTELQDLTSEIQETRRLKHAEIVEKILSAMDAEDQELIDKVKNGEITLQEFKEELKNKYAELSDEDKQEFREKLKTDYIQRRVLKANRILTIREKRAEEISERLSKRADALKAKGFSGASDRLRNKSDAFKTRSQNVGSRKSTFLDKVIGRRNAK